MTSNSPSTSPLAGPPTEFEGSFVGDLGDLIDAGRLSAAFARVDGLHHADLARVISNLPRANAERLFVVLDAPLAAQVLAELDDALSEDLLEDVGPERLKRLLNALDSDDAADVMARLPEEMVQRVLPLLEAAEAIEGLMAYHEETAGGIMAKELVAVPPDWTVSQATEEVRRNRKTVEELYVIFVVDDGGRLKGFVSIKRLLLSPSDARIGDVMNEDVLSVTTDIDQEEVVRIMERYDLTSLAVVDDGHRLVGRVTIDDAIDVIREEAEEDYQRLSGITGDEEPSDTVGRITRGRLPWLLLGMVGAALAGSVIGAFEETIRRVSILAAFIPVVMAMAGNAGIQSSAIVVQGLASGDLWSTNIMRRLGKEVLVAVINGVALALAIMAVVVLIFVAAADLLPESSVGQPVRLAITAGLSLFIVILIAAAIGTTIPLLLDRVGIDPALATGPFITTSNDIIGLVVFFVLATTLYLPFL